MEMQNGEQKSRLMQVGREMFGNLKAFSVLILLLIAFSLLNGNFVRTNNLITILQQSSHVAILAYAETLVIITGGIDLSLGSILGLSGVVVGKLLLAGAPIPLAVLGALTVGGLCGLLNGFLVAKAKLVPFIATLGMQNIARGVAYVVTNSLPISGLPEDFYYIGGGKIGIIPVPVVVMLVLAAMFSFMMNKCTLGRRIYALGSNREAARLSGIKNDRTEIGVFAIGGVMAGIVGVILASRVVSSQPNAGVGYESDAIAAAIIGGTSPSGGSGTILGTVIGALTIAELKNGLNILQVNAFWQQVAIGIVIIVAVFIDRIRKDK